MVCMNWVGGSQAEARRVLRGWASQGVVVVGNRCPAGLLHREECAVGEPCSARRAEGREPSAHAGCIAAGLVLGPTASPLPLPCGCHGQAGHNLAHSPLHAR